MNRKSRARKRPIVPMNVAQSQTVAVYMPHDDGRKSRWRLVMTITKRSSHIPTLTTIAISEEERRCCERTRRNQRSWGVRMLQKISAQ